MVPPKKVYLISLLLSLPIVAVYLIHFSSDGGIPGARPSGFLMYDAPYYMANARELTDDGGFHLMYSNPFSHDYQSERIYFQPQTLLLGLAFRLSGIDPGILLCLFGLLFTLLFFRVLLECYDRLFGLKTRRDWFFLVLLAWGGGVFSVAGTLHGFLNGLPLAEALKTSSLFEPSGGWWFLNLGRNMILPTEAYYHFLFFLSLLLIIRKKYTLALVSTALLSLSHPFTGIQMLLILAGWGSIEILISKARFRPVQWFTGGIFLMLIFHIGYYLFFLRQNPEHEQLFHQWKLAWIVSTPAFILAWGWGMLLAGYRIFRCDFLTDFRQQPMLRLIGIWFVVSFLLSNHDLFIQPVQPLHFTRGYVWSSLFLLSVPVMYRITDYLDRRILVTGLRMGVYGLLLLLLLSDNLVWMSNTARDAATNPYLFNTREELELYTELNKEEYRGRLVVSTDLKTGYRITAYTPLRSWYSHMHNTPNADTCLKQLRQISEKGVIPEVIRRNNPLLILPTTHIPDSVTSGNTIIWSNKTYSIVGSYLNN